MQSDEFSCMYLCNQYPSQGIEHCNDSKKFSTTPFQSVSINQKQHLLFVGLFIAEYVSDLFIFLFSWSFGLLPTLLLIKVMSLQILHASF